MAGVSSSPGFPSHVSSFEQFGSHQHIWDFFFFVLLTAVSIRGEVSRIAMNKRERVRERERKERNRARDQSVTMCMCFLLPLFPNLTTDLFSVEGDR